MLITRWPSLLYSCGMPTWQNPVIIGLRGMGERNPYRERIRDVLQASSMPMDVENVRQRTGLKNWESTKALLLEMVLLGTIMGEKTTKGWIFWTEGGRRKHRA